MASLKIKRRSLLKGVLGGATVTVGLPPLEAMFNGNGTAHADGTPLARRLGVFFWGGGVKHAHWNPATIGPGWTLSRSLLPLEPLRPYINLVSGMDIKIPSIRGHHTGIIGIMSGAPGVAQPRGNAPFRSTFSGASIDQIAGTEIGKNLRWKSLEVGISRRLNRFEGTSLYNISHNGPDNVNPALYDPAAVWTKLFGGAAPPPGGAEDKLRPLRRSILDVVRTDMEKLKQRVSTRDRTRLDQHLEGIRSLERGLFGPTDCGSPPSPGAIADAAKGESLEELTQAMARLIALALSCDQTRVFTMLFSGSVNGTVFWQVGATRGHHSLTHDEGGDQPQVQACTEYTMKMFGHLAQALKDTPEGAGNLLDNTVIMGSSDVADGRAHSTRDYPIVLAGRGGGLLKHPGIHHRAPGENTSQVLLTMLRAVGMDRAEVGAEGGRTTASCTAIEA